MSTFFVCYIYFNCICYRINGNFIVLGNKNIHLGLFTGFFLFFRRINLLNRRLLLTDSFVCADWFI